jgi:TatD DNase family protein
LYASRYFPKQLEIAEATGLPLFLHDRNTGTDFLGMGCRASYWYRATRQLMVATDFAIDIMRANRHRISGGVVHSFTGTIDELEHLLALDLYIGMHVKAFAEWHSID